MSMNVMQRIEEYFIFYMNEYIQEYIEDLQDLEEYSDDMLRRAIFDDTFDFGNSIFDKVSDNEYLYILQYVCKTYKDKYNIDFPISDYLDKPNVLSSYAYFLSHDDRVYFSNNVV